MRQTHNGQAKVAGKQVRVHTRVRLEITFDAFEIRSPVIARKRYWDELPELDTSGNIPQG
jgi:hypothetical protein